MALPSLWLLVLLTLLVGTMTVISWRQRQQPGTRAFSMMAVGITWWVGTMTLGHVLDQYVGLHTTFVALTRIEWLGIFVMAISWFIFALQYTGRGEYATRRVVALLGAFPIVIYPIAFTNGLIVDAVAGVVGIQTGLGASFDPWLLVEPIVLAYVYTLIAVGTLLIVGFLLTSRLPHPEEAILWLLAVVVPWLVNALYVTGVIPPLGPAMIDPTPLGFVVLVAIGLLSFDRYDAFGIAPVARAYVLDQLDTGVVVYDADRRIQDANEWAQTRLAIDATDSGRDVWTILSTVSDEVPVADAATDNGSFSEWIDGRTLEIDTGDDSRAVTVETTRLARPASRSSGAEGQALVLRDETERIEREQLLETKTEQLELLNQIVRHDIRNDVEIAQGMLTLLEEHVDQEGEENLQTVEDRVEHVAALTQTVGDLTETIAGDETDRHPVELAPVIEAVASEVRDSYPDSEVLVADIPAVAVRADDMLASVFTNLLRNAVQHNDAATPAVSVTVEDRSQSVLVTIRDNGPGIEPDRRERIFERGRQGSASEGSGLGLYLVETLVEKYGGSVEVDAARYPEDSPIVGARKSGHSLDSPGTEFRVTLPTA